MTERHQIFRRLLKKQQARKKAEAEAVRLERARQCASKYRYVTRHKGRWLVRDPRAGRAIGSFPTEEIAGEALAAVLGVPLDTLLRVQPDGTFSRPLFHHWLYGR